MVSRRDGVETRAQLLTAAADVFADRGYSEALVADICERAGANVAAINYHFGGKEALYVEVWRCLGEEAQSLYPPSGGAPPDAPLEERLGDFVLAMLQRMTDGGRLSCFHRLREHERVAPTGLIDDVVRRMHEPSRQVLQALVCEGLGSDAPAEAARLVEFSIINQCRGVLGRECFPAHPLLEKPITAAAREGLAVHIARFCTGGMAAVRQTFSQKVST